MIKNFIFIVLSLFPLILKTQSLNTDSLKTRKSFAVAAVSITGITTHAVLYSTWYTEKARSFHWKNDNADWLQMDKMGHAWSSFFLNEACTETFKYGGYSPGKAANLGLLSSLLFQNTIEYFDGRSNEWGASYGDLIANSAGALFSWGQHKLWKKIKIPFKFSVLPSKYAKLRPNMLGKNIPERMLKDYNGQTYWLCFQGNRLNFGKKWPKWLGFAIGYGATGMLGGKDNVFSNGTVINDYSNIPRLRQFYFSPHISLGHLHSKNKGIKLVFNLTEVIRLPMPNLEINNKGKVKLNLFMHQ